MRLVIFLLSFILVALCSAWQWLRPYQLGVDESNLYRIHEVTVKRDTNYYWITISLDSPISDMVEKMQLITNSGESIDAADIRYISQTKQFVARFWLEKNYMQNVLWLQFPTGRLQVKKYGEFELPDQTERIFSHTNW